MLLLNYTVMLGPLVQSYRNRGIRSGRTALPDIESFGGERRVFSREEKRSIWTIWRNGGKNKLQAVVAKTIGRGIDGTCAANG